MATIAVIGAGAVGGVIAARLMLSNAHSVAVATRTAIDVLEITRDGASFRVVPDIVDRDAAREPRDWVLVATKAPDSTAAAEWFEVLVGPHTTVAILQNGVEHRERFAGYVPDDQLLPVVVNVPAERPAPGRVTQHGPGVLTVPHTSAGHEFARLFIGTGIDVVEADDFTTAAWEKLCLNAAGAISALALTPNVSGREPAIEKLIRAVVHETILVGNAEGASLTADIADEIVRSFCTDTPQGVNSMLADRLAGRPLETDARNGAVVRFGAAHGIPTPANDTLVGLLRAASRTPICLGWS